MKLIKPFNGKEFKKPKSNSCGVLVKNPINVEDVYQYDETSVIVKYKNGNKVKYDGFNIIQDTHFKMKGKLAEMIKSFKIDPSLIIDNPTDEEIQIGCIIIDDKGNKIKITDENKLKEVVKTYFIEYNTADIFKDGSCIMYIPFKENGNDLTGNAILDIPANGRFDNVYGYYKTYADNDNCKSKTIFKGGNLNYVKSKDNFHYFELGKVYTMSVQIKIRDLNHPFTILQTGNYSNNADFSLANRIDFRVGNSNNMFFGVGGKTDNSQSSISSGYNWSVYEEFPIDNDLHTITVVRDNLYVALYKDGQKLWEHQFVDGSINNPTHIYAIEANSGNCWDYAGYMRNIRFFNRVLTDDEIKKLAQES